MVTLIGRALGEAVRNPAVRARLTSLLKLDKNANVLAAARAKLAAMPASVTTYATIIAEETPSIIRTILKEGGEDEANELFKIVGNLREHDSIELDEITGDRDEDFYGIEADDALKNVDAIAFSNKNIEICMEQLCLNLDQLSGFWAAFAALEPQSFAVYKMTKGS